MASKLIVFMVCAIVVVISVSMCDGWGCEEPGRQCSWDYDCCSGGCLYDRRNCGFLRLRCFGDPGKCMDYKDVRGEPKFLTYHYIE